MKNNTTKDKSEVFYSFKIGENLFVKIEKITNYFKLFEEQSKTKREWILEAIREKLESEEKNGIKPPKQRNLSFRVTPDLFEKIEARVKLISKAHRSFSKKQWFLEALYEKLDRDINILNKFHKRINTNSSET